eukprot:3076813-Heterocapsa_arctica.AAC.1
MRWTFLAQDCVAHPMVTAKARPDSPVPPKLLIFYVFSDLLDGYFSKCCCASDGANRSGSNSGS